MIQNASMRDSLKHLAAQLGIAPGYYDIKGDYHLASEATLRHLIAAMGMRCDSEDDELAGLALLNSLQRKLPACKVLVSGRDAWSIPLPAEISDQPADWEIHLEHGGTLKPECADMLLRLPQLPLGYHRLISGKHQAQTLLIVAPPTCYQPDWLKHSQKTWGISVQLYGLRTCSDWGVGDYTGLARLADWVSNQGGGIVGINPLHALPMHDPEHASPYSPVSREFFNPLYLDITAIDEFATCMEAREEFVDVHFQSRLRALNQSDLVRYNEIAALKLPLLGLLHRHFRLVHLDTADSRGQAFRAYQSQGGEALFRYALFCALQAHFHHLDGSVSGWHQWPTAYHDFRNPAVAAFARENAEAVEFYQYLQWQCETQLARAGKVAWDRQMHVGIYGDLAVGAHPSGADTWIEPACYSRGASIGAPPDAFAPMGQNWGLPPWTPHHLSAAAYAPFIRMLRANMRHAGALRIDHIMGLYRLFWVPAGQTASEGAYVHYPHEDLFAILALESQRNFCMIVGEDLGTVPDEVRELMSRYGLLSTRLMMFEKRWDGAYKPPYEYPFSAISSFGSHDTPTFDGFWTGRDIDWHNRIGTYMDDTEHQMHMRQRERDKLLLMENLEANGCPIPGEPDSPASALAAPVYGCLAKSASAVVMVSAEDLLGSGEASNIPGTIDQHPNWRRRLPLNLENWMTHPRVESILTAVRAER